ncbi:Protein misato-like protein 1 [Rhynchospora pubera]|uniref:Protein misato-like protein 1 n=1 Tax=Rhynchospora pubera TaxID=906938 RepID=A0AAV8DX75_9POAL|nr:Protein misato-like protein 1 [Rhynchospora pubera]
MREIVTIQVGDFANYIGSHFWNFQDELLGLAEDDTADPIFKNNCMDMDVLYRTGLTHQGAYTYCPRLISIGSQGSLGTLSSSGSLYGDSSSSDASDTLTWKGAVTKLAEEPREKNLFLKSLSKEGEDDPNIEDKDRVQCLERDVKFWSDFSKVHFHSKSLYELNGTWTDFQNFDNFGVGKEVLSGGFHMEELNDRLRFFVEECDHVQGIQCMVDDSGGFSGVASEFLENIADDYTNIPVLLYSVRDTFSYTDATNQRKLIARSLHDAVSLSKLSTYSSLIVPVGLPSLGGLAPSLCVRDDKNFHSSAVYASAIHSISAPFRFKPAGPISSTTYAAGSLDIGEIIHILAGQRQNMVAILDVSMPAPSLSVSDKANPGGILNSFHALGTEIGDDSEDLYMDESLIFNGALYSGADRASVSQVKDSICNVYDQGLRAKPRPSHLSISLTPIPIPLPFPSIFPTSTGRRGEILADQPLAGPPKGSLEVESVPVMTRLRSSIAIKPFIESRYNNLLRHGMLRGAKGADLLRDWGFGKDEVDDMGEYLSKMLRIFKPSSEMTSDSD